MSLEISKLNKSYGSKRILEDISFEVVKGEIVSITGPSGGGKTTLIRCMNNLEDYEEGSITVDGENIVANDIGLVFQNFNLFPHMTVLENIIESPMNMYKMDKEDIIIKAKKLLEKVGLEEKIDYYPYQLSGGQKQRVALVRALILDPKFICLDEPTSALDPALKEEVIKLITSLKNEGLGIIVVTHDIDLANRVSDKIFYLNDKNLFYSKKEDIMSLS